MINLYNSDSLEAIKEYPDNYWDLAIVDPPYGIGHGGNKINSKSVKKDGSLINKIDKRRGNKIIVKPLNYHNKYKDEKPPDKKYFDELFRVSKNQIVWGANHYISRMPYDSSCWIVWDKVNGNTDQSDCELAWTSFKTGVRLFRFMWNGFTQGKSITEGHINQGNKRLCEKRCHPNQKPVALYKWTLREYAKEGYKILDTHRGSGSIDIACADMGFDLDAWELDTEYFAAATKRLQNHVRQLNAFQDKPEINVIQKK